MASVAGQRGRLLYGWTHCSPQFARRARPRKAALREKRESMSKKLFVGSLSWDTNDEGLRTAFSPHGEVSEAVVISDRDTGRSGQAALRRRRRRRRRRRSRRLRRRLVDPLYINLKTPPPREGFFIAEGATYTPHPRGQGSRLDQGFQIGEHGVGLALVELDHHLLS